MNPPAPATVDFSARYRVAGWGGIAFYLLGWAVDVEFDPAPELVCADEDCTHEEDDCWMFSDEPETIESDEVVRAVMVGDDREHLVDVSDLTVLADDEYCGVCGQIGCTHDGR